MIRNVCAPSSVIPPSTSWSRSGASNTNTTPTSTASSWPTNSAWPGVCDGDGSGGPHRRRAADRSACARLLAGRRGTGRALRTAQRGQHRSARRLRLGFDTQLGFAIRAHCAPLLGLPKHAEPQDYWQRRSQFTETELARIFLARGRRQRLAGRHRLRRGRRGRGARCRAVRQPRSRGGPPRTGGRAGRAAPRVTTRRRSRRSCDGARPRPWAPNRSWPTAAGSTAT